MKIKHTSIFITVIAFVMVVGIFYTTSPWIGKAYFYCEKWWSERAKRKAWLEEVKKMRVYYKNLSKPNLGEDQVIYDMRRQGGLLNENKELRRMVEYYVYHGSESVISQLVANLPHEVELSLPEETEGSDAVFLRDVKGKSYSILLNRYGILKKIAPVLHHEFHRQAPHETSGNMIYLLITLISSNEKLVPTSDLNIFRNNDEELYYNIDWYTPDLVRKDVKAYLQTYNNFRDWPTIRDTIERALYHYPGNWLNWTVMKQCLHITETKGPDIAYDTFIKSFTK